MPASDVVYKYETMKTELNIAESLSLPVDVVTATMAILAKRRSGKTYCANVLAEEMLAAGAHIVALDPLGVWWGLRSGADGDPAGGLPIVIVGGDHADIPLDPAQGAVVADLVTEERLSCVLDVSRLSRAQMTGFVAAFLFRLFETNREALHLFVDEADMFAPQSPTAPGQSQTLDALDNVVRRGGSRGLGTTLITQRPAVLSKNLLTQADVMIALRITAPQDRSAVDDWIKGHGTNGERRLVLDSLATMDIGQAWVWAPNHTEQLAKTQIRLRQTFDASSTPKVGESIRVPQALADVNMSALAERFAVQLEAAKENDPVALRAQIAELKKRLADSPTPEPIEVTVEKIVEKIVEVPVIAESEILKLCELRDSMTGTAKDLMNMAGEITSRLGTLIKPAPVIPPLTVNKDAAPKPVKEASSSTNPAPSMPTLVPEEIRMLGALAAYPSHRMTAIQLSVMAQVSHGDPKSLWGVALINLQALDFVKAGSHISLTQKGKEVLAVATGKPVPAPMGSALDVWARHLPARSIQILRWLREIRPRVATRAEVARRVGLTPTAGTLSKYIASLYDIGLIIKDGSGRMRAADDIP